MDIPMVLSFLAGICLGCGGLLLYLSPGDSLVIPGSLVRKLRDPKVPSSWKVEALTNFLADRLVD